ncbi:efflux transporter outer membrane subunit [Roseomonas nepalensis]|uniref:Efflux transporter outer membrane subunit n=1 Tax=Muricoccus nepalensis TaxID=1854500 RepID=A0A502FWQ3_9PROT|nr:efflux transporter outer membrane subunit [Roseomonas nepalensis]TPG53496.1 efflux transporter outer membrane subunit [Roseomonas nepalensis]
MRATLPLLLAGLLAGPLAGCTLDPDFQSPEATRLDAYNQALRTRGVIMESRPDPRWWSEFHDPVLDSLVTRTVAGNLTLQQSVQRVVQARQGEATARAAGLPSLGGSGSYTRQQLGLRGLLESRGAFGAANGLRGNQTLENADPGLSNRAADSLSNGLNALTRPINLFQAGFDAEWELDLFGRIRRGQEQAGAQTEAAIESSNDALVTLIGEVVQTYSGLRAAQALARAQETNIGAARNLLALTQRRQRDGLSPQIDVENQRAQLTSYEAQLQPFAAQAQQAMNRLAVLMGRPPGMLDDELGPPRPIPPAPPRLPVGVPSELARRRPDIRRAEATLHAATAGIGVAVAQFYPSVSLTGNLGLRGTEISALSSWANHFYSAGPTVSLPIFQGGRLTANLALARSQQVEAALAYRAVVLGALGEVEDSLVAYRTDQTQRDKLRQTVASTRTVLTLARDRYDNGLGSFIEVLDAQRSLVGAQQAEIRATLSVTNDVISLYKALGGGWSPEDWTALAEASAPSRTPLPILRP